ncbi:hypothetical protein [Streptosporangium sp. NPDC002721]|uniref:hypothetical protein n=1 Tax=Streptosporangium sp. NPDC002721 TaxID=3366188 RepID=UPI0036C4F70A
MPRTSLLAAALAVSVCLANASAVSAASSSPTRISMGATHASMSAEPSLLQRPQTLVTSKQKAVIKIRTLLTTFFTDQQLSKILDKLAEDIYANKPFKESFATLITPNILTASQAANLANLGLPLTKALAVLSRRFEPYYLSISKKILAMKSSGRTKADCFDQVYVMAAGYLIKVRIKPVLTDIKSSLTSKEWQTVRTRGAALFLWSGYGL